jgi:hypothetical protein
VCICLGNDGKNRVSGGELSLSYLIFSWWEDREVLIDFDVSKDGFQFVLLKLPSDTVYLVHGNSLLEIIIILLILISYAFNIYTF